VSQPLRAVYQAGQLRLLDSVNLSEGQEVQVLILSDDDQVRSALGDLLIERSDSAGDVDEEALFREIEAGFRGQPPLSETLIEERLDGP
jgi:predicted DNA-binding antitoxin AbrB/MazE fold protein